MPSWRAEVMGSSRQEQVVGHLPLEINTMVGRRQETADVRGLMASQRLVTLTGPGGIGKTRTALHVARSARRTFADGAWFVELGPVRDPALLDQVALETLKVPNSTAREPRSVLVDYLLGRKILLVLDNCEHLLAGAAALVEALLQEVAGVCRTRSSSPRSGTSRVTRRSSSSQRVPGQPWVTSTWTRPTTATSSDCARSWRACRWHSSWRRRGSR